jgi:hypothetical protein
MPECERSRPTQFPSEIKQIGRWPMFGFRGFSWIAESGLVSLVYCAFTIWMLVECLRKDPERYLWWWIILIVPPIGPIL